MDKVKRIQELRRSNAATAIPSKKKYTRKKKHRDKYDQSLTACRLDKISWARKGVGAKDQLRQAPTHPENCELYHMTQALK